MLLFLGENVIDPLEWANTLPSCLSGPLGRSCRGHVLPAPRSLMGIERSLRLAGMEKAFRKWVGAVQLPPLDLTG